MDAFYNLFVDPPRGASAQYAMVPFFNNLFALGVALVVGAIYTYRTRSPLFVWSMICGATLYPFLVEPFGDLFIAVWYPTNHPIALTVFDRPMPWLAFFFYAAFIPLCVALVWTLLKRGATARTLFFALVVITVLEVPLELIGIRYDWMIYYGNHATVLGLPIYCLPQNGGMFAPVALYLAWVMPRMSGWRWVLFPFGLAAVLPVFALVTTWPAYLAIQAEAGPFWGWTAGIIAFVLNTAVVVWACYAAIRVMERTPGGQRRIGQPATAAPAPSPEPV